MILRDFLFLDTQILDDYLAALEGYIIEGNVEETEMGEKQAGGGIGAAGISANAKSSRATETKRTLAVTDAAKFQHFHKSLIDIYGEDAIQYLESFDEAIWNQLQKGEILEIEAEIRLPQALLMMQDVKNITPMLELMQMLGQDLLKDEQSRVAFEGMNAVSRLTDEKSSVPIICEAIGTKGYTFLAYLPRKHIRRDIQELQGEATLFGKIQRIIPRKQKIQAFSLVPSIKSINSLNRKERRKLEKTADDKNITEFVKGPAIILTPLAVYR